MVSMRERLNRQAIGAGVQVYNPAQQVTPRRRVSTSNRYTPPQRQRGDGGGNSIKEWEARADLERPGWRTMSAMPQEEEQGNPFWKQGLGFIIDNPVVRTIAKGGAIVDTPGRVVRSTMKEITDLQAAMFDTIEENLGIPNPYEVSGYNEQNRDTVSANDWLNQIKDFDFGMGKVIPDTDNKWADRTIGFAGDVVTDPFTWVAGGAGTAGRAAKSVKAAKLLDAQRNSDEALQLVQAWAKQAPGAASDDLLAATAKRADELGGSEVLDALGRRNYSAASDAQLEAMGLPAYGLRMRGSDAIVPGTGAPMRKLAEGRGAFVEGVKNRMPGARGITHTRTPTGYLGQELTPAFDRFSGFGSNNMPVEQALDEISFDRSTRLFGQQFSSRAAKQLDRAAKVIREAGPEQVKKWNREAALSPNVSNPLTDLAQQFRQIADELGVELPNYTGVAGGSTYSMPQTLSRDFRNVLTRALDADDTDVIAKDFADTIGVFKKDLLKDSGFLAKKKFIPGETVKIGDKEFTIKYGTPEELNEQFGKMFPNYDGPIYETNPLLAYRHYIDGVSKEVGKRGGGRREAARGSTLLRDAGPAPESFDPAGGRVTLEGKSGSGEVAARIDSGAQTYTTAKGSEYTLHPDGTSSRVKAAGAGSLTGQAGPQPTFEKVAFLSPEDARAVASAQAQGIPHKGPNGELLGIRVDDANLDGPGFLASQRGGASWQEAFEANGGVVTPYKVKVSSQPTKGMQPLEYNLSNGTIHMGDTITDVAPPRVGFQENEFYRGKRNAELSEARNEEILKDKAFVDEAIDNADINMGPLNERVARNVDQAMDPARSGRKVEVDARSKLKTEKRAIMAELPVVRARQAEIEKTLPELQREISNLQAKLRRTKGSTAGKRTKAARAKAKKDATDLTSEIKAAEKRVAALEKELPTVRAEAEDIAKIKDIMERQAAAQSGFDDAVAKIAEGYDGRVVSQAEMAEAQKVIDSQVDIRRALRDQQARVNRIEAQISGRQVKGEKIVPNTEARVEALQAEKAQAEAVLKIGKGLNQELQDAIATKNAFDAWAEVLGSKNSPVADAQRKLRNVNREAAEAVRDLELKGMSREDIGLNMKASMDSGGGIKFDELDDARQTISDTGAELDRVGDEAAAKAKADNLANREALQAELDAKIEQRTAARAEMDEIDAINTSLMPRFLEKVKQIDAADQRVAVFDDLLDGPAKRFADRGVSSADPTTYRAGENITHDALQKAIDDGRRLADSTATTSRETIRAINNTKSLLATDAEDLAKVRAMKESTDGQAKLMKDARDGSLPQIVVADLKDKWSRLAASDPDSTIVVADDLASKLQNIEKMNKTPGMLGRALEFYTNFFKTYAVATPGFHVRNAMGALFTNAADDVSVAKTLAAGKEWVKFAKSEDPAAYLRKLANGTAQERQLADAFGATFGTGAGGRYFDSGVADATASASKWREQLFANRPVRELQKFGEYIEGPARLAVARDTIAKGGTLDEAMERINRIHFDYSQTSKFDDSIKKAIPFWTFMSRNLPTQLTLMYSKPRVYSRYHNFIKNFGEDNDPLTPEYWTDGGAFTLNIPGFGATVVSPDLQHNRLNNELGAIADLMSLDPKKALATANPGLTAPVEYATGTNFFTGYNTPADATRNMGPLDIPAAFLTALMPGQEGQVNERVAEFLASTVPPLAQAERVVPAASGDEWRKGTGTEGALRWGGLPVRRLTEERREAEAKRQGVPYVPLPN